MVNAVVGRIEGGKAYLQIGGEMLKTACPLPKGMEAAEGDRALAEKVSGKYMIITLYGGE